MKTENQSLANDLTISILGNFNGLNVKNAKKLVKLVDDSTRSIVKKFVKYQKEEVEKKEKKAKKEAKKELCLTKDGDKPSLKLAKRQALESKIAIVCNEKNKVAKTTPKVVKVA